MAKLMPILKIVDQSYERFSSDSQLELISITVRVVYGNISLKNFILNLQVLRWKAQKNSYSLAPNTVQKNIREEYTTVIRIHFSASSWILWILPVEFSKRYTDTSLDTVRCTIHVNECYSKGKLFTARFLTLHLFKPFLRRITSNIVLYPILQTWTKIIVKCKMKTVRTR
jgi:hypothetical protein